MKIALKSFLLGTSLLVILSAFVPKAPVKSLPATITPIEAKQGKAYWYVTYTLTGSKKLYITPVFNNNCDHCRNEIAEAFKKHLVMYNYDTKASTVYIASMHDVKESAAEERRNEEIYKRKQQGFSVTSVSFNYQD